MAAGPPPSAPVDTTLRDHQPGSFRRSPQSLGCGEQTNASPALPYALSYVAPSPLGGTVLGGGSALLPPYSAPATSPSRPDTATTPAPATPVILSQINGYRAPLQPVFSHLAHPSPDAQLPGRPRLGHRGLGSPNYKQRLARAGWTPSNSSRKPETPMRDPLRLIHRDMQSEQSQGIASARSPGQAGRSAASTSASWSAEELAAFEAGVYLFGRELRSVQKLVASRTVRVEPCPVPLPLSLLMPNQSHRSYWSLSTSALTAFSAGLHTSGFQFGNPNALACPMRTVLPWHALHQFHKVPIPFPASALSPSPILSGTLPASPVLSASLPRYCPLTLKAIIYKTIPLPTSAIALCSVPHQSLNP